ncbi:Prefoldin chaperone subunit family protein [Striga hermonthica]|uniref:Prefoldin chaperone subunit family protein n=1 Tax=Striga hermonthica TaxID=68872 RepID=A0A9N7RBP5_STRHE|nr:Prefoldin chaperone subunit family protein [Striga hermonthica]
MAKKKVSHSQLERASSKPDDLVKEVAPPMDPEASEKLQNLKSLNQRLLKEAVERRQLVDSLVQCKTSLETELTRSSSEVEVLNSELARMGETAAKLELETSVVASFVGMQLGAEGEAARREMNELKRVIDEKVSAMDELTVKLRETEGLLGNQKEVSRRVGLERDEVKEKLDLQIEEGRRMKENLVELEEREMAVERELGELRDAYDCVVGDNGSMKLRIETITKEKNSIQRSLTESNKLVEDLREELSGVIRERKLIEDEKESEVVRSQKLEKDVNTLNELIDALQKEEVNLRDVVAMLENKCSTGEERLKEMEREIDQLLEEKKAIEEKIEGLAAHKTAVERELKDKLEKLAEEKLKSEALVKENANLVEAKSSLENEVSILQKQVTELKSVVSKMEESSRVEAGKIVSLVSEVGNYRLNLERVKTERDNMKVYLDEEKANALKLKDNIAILEGKIEDILRASEKVKADKSVLFAEKVELESQCEVLKKEIASLENARTEWRKERDSMKGRVQKLDVKSGVVLNMVKETAAFCSEDNDDIMGAGDWVSSSEEETKAYAAELELIKSAFKNKVGKIDSMKRQLEQLQVSVEDAHKKKSFWTILSSATTLLAAVSLAYVVRGHS